MIITVRRYFIVFILPVLISALLIIAPFFFLYPLINWSSWGLLIFFGILGIGLILAFRVFIVYSFNIFIITNQRIIDIDQHGFFSRTVSETIYEKIQDVSFKIKGIMRTIFHYGDIIIQTAGSQANIELHGVKDPAKVQQAIIDIQKNYRQNGNLPEEVINDFIKKVQAVNLHDEINDKE